MKKGSFARRMNVFHSKIEEKAEQDALPSSPIGVNTAAVAEGDEPYSGNEIDAALDSLGSLASPLGVTASTIEEDEEDDESEEGEGHTEEERV